MKSKKAKIKCKTMPNTVTDLELNEMHAKNATVSWKAYTGLDPNEFEKYEVEIKDVIKDEIKKQSTTLSKYTITNLAKNTKYDVCIRIVSKSFGKSECSNKVVIR